MDRALTVNHDGVAPTDRSPGIDDATTNGIGKSASQVDAQLMADLDEQQRATERNRAESISRFAENSAQKPLIYQTQLHASAALERYENSAVEGIRLNAFAHLMEKCGIVAFPWAEDYTNQASAAMDLDRDLQSVKSTLSDTELAAAGAFAKYQEWDVSNPSDLDGRLGAEQPLSKSCERARDPFVQQAVSEAYRANLAKTAPQRRLDDMAEEMRAQSDAAQAAWQARADPSRF